MHSEKKDATPKPQTTDESVIYNTIISNMYEFTKDRFNQFPSSPFLSEKSNIQVYYYNLKENSVRLTGTIYLNEYSENTIVTISFEYADEFPSNKHTIEKNLSHTKRNEYALDTEIPLENYYSAYLTITQGDGKSNFISLDNGFQHNFLYHVLFSHLNLTIPTDENGQLKLDTVVFDPTIYNTYRDNLFWGYWDTSIVITLLDEKTGHNYDEFKVNLKEKTVHQLKAPLKENTPISIRFTFEGVPAPFTPTYLIDIGILQYFKELTFGTKLDNNNYLDYETEIPISFTINHTNEEYIISRLPISFNEKTHIYSFEDEPFSN